MASRKMDGTTPRLGLADAKARVVELVAGGSTVDAAMADVGRAPKTYEMWRSRDKEFAAEVDRVRADRQAAKARGANPDLRKMGFEEFCRTYLHVELYPHQKAWVDVLEGRTPQLGPADRFHEGNPQRLLVNVPPGHAKSTTLTAMYPVYRICMNPAVRIIIISQTKSLADDFLYQIKAFLTDPRYSKLQADFAPEGGFKEDGKAWNSNRIRVRGASEAAGDAVVSKDATVEALGWGSQIYGRRADLIILDDVATLGNAHQYEKQIRQINQDVASRLHGGKLMVVGTRVGPQDLYSELAKGENYNSGRSPWTHLVQPAVQVYADNPTDWVTLWPYSTTPYDLESEKLPNGMYQMFDGPKLDGVRGSMPPATWALVYQQEDTSGIGLFSPTCVWGSVNRRRKPGPMRAGAWGGPRNGKEGMYTIASMDPAMVGETFTVVGSVDRETQKRWIENAFVAPGSATYIRDTIRQVTEEYQVNEWVIEANAFQLFLTQDPEITNFLNARGVKLTPHYTGGFNKQDPDFGVAALAPLFGTTRRINDGAGREVHNGDNFIELPDPDYSQGVKTLIEELFTWVPGKRGKDLRQDGPMALWFFNLRAMQILGFGRSNAPTLFRQSKFMTRNQKARRVVAPQYTFGEVR